MAMKHESTNVCVVLLQIVPGGAASRTNLKIGDRILKVGNNYVSDTFIFICFKVYNFLFIY